MKQRKIGDVRFLELHKEPEETYSDGDIETKLLNLFESKKVDVEAFKSKHPGWATTYHLSPARENLLNWYDFEPGSTLLEVGAGCGGLTGLFARSCKQVTALELSKRRALVNAHRHNTHANLEVIVGNLEHLYEQKKEKFDYVVCVGVLEYAGRFINHEEPFRAFLEELRRFTKPNGTLVLAIENKLGLKYWAGAKEDHVRRYVEGIEGYPHYDGIRTFGKEELSKLMRESGYKETNFYYPFPDYKLPHAVFSDSYLPGVHTSDIPSSLYPTPTPDQSRLQLFREQLAIRSVSNNGLYGDFANSFLAFATPSAKSKTCDVVFSRGSINRKQEFRIMTRIHRDKKSFKVSKQALNDNAKSHINDLFTNKDTLESALKKSRVSVDPILSAKEGDTALAYIDGVSLETRLIEALLNHDTVRAKDIVNDFISIVDSLPTKSVVPTSQSGFQEVFGGSYDQKTRCIEPGIIDLNFDNIIIDKSGVHTIIDYEWVFPFLVPRDFVIGRAITYFLERHSQIVRATIGDRNPGIEISPQIIVPVWLYEKHKTVWDENKKIREAETAFQRYVGGTPTAAFRRDATTKTQATASKPRTINTELVDNVPDVYENTLHSLETLMSQRAQEQKEAQELRRQMHLITTSRTWKTLQKISRIRQRLKI